MERESTIVAGEVRYISKYSAYDNFLNAIRNQATKTVYTIHLKLYLNFSKLSSYDQLLELDNNSAFNLLRDFIIYNIDNKKNSISYTASMLKPIKLFYEVNQKQYLFWKQLARFHGKVTKAVDDRLYTDEELRLLIEHSDIRAKTIILTLLSSGMRVGGLTDLKLGDITYLKEHRIYKIIVYSQDIAYRYTTFTTPECATAIQLYLKYREKEGELLTAESPFVATSFHIKRSTDSFVTRQAIQKILDRERYKAGIFSQERDARLGQARKAVPRAHVFRKMFNTRCIEAGMNHYVKETLMGHKVSLGLDVHYYRPTETQLLQEYLKVIDTLTVNEEFRLSKQVQELKEKEDYQSYVIDKKIQEKENELKILTSKIQELEKTQQQSQTGFSKEQKHIIEQLILQMGHNMGSQAYDYAKKYVDIYVPADNDKFSESDYEDYLQMSKKLYDENIDKARKEHYRKYGNKRAIRASELIE